MAYEFSDSLGVWIRSGFAGLAYSDGPAAEEYLQKVMRQAVGRETFSEGLRTAIVDWPSEYHLSRKRHCLLRPLGIRPGDSVLELGSGCGAISRYLGEIGAEVTAVEGSPIRAGIGAARCHGLDNVKVYCDDLRSFQSDQRYDWVLLIGVLEYASMFAADSDGAASYLKSVVRMLKRSGRLVVGIENKLGLKYFNACAEDHVGKAFFGIQGLYRTSGPATYGRRELEDQLLAAGMPIVTFLYPFPDYKLPTVVMTEQAMTDTRLFAPDLLLRDFSRDYGGSAYRLFNEALVARELHANGVLQDFSNSFLAVAGTTQWKSADGALAWSFAVERHAPFCTQTTFVEDGGNISVRKERLQAVDCKLAYGGARFEHHVEDSRYVEGRLLLGRLLTVVARGEGVGSVCDVLDPWFRFLLHQSKRHETAARLEAHKLPGRFLDCTPFNVIEAKAGLVDIDDEWRTVGPVELGLVVTRGIYWSIYWPLQQSLKQLMPDILSELARRYGLEVDRRSIPRWLEQERQFQAWAQQHDSGALPMVPDNKLVLLLESISGGEHVDMQDHIRRYRQLARQYEALLCDVSDLKSKMARILDRIGKSHLRSSSELPVDFNPIRYVFFHPDLLEAEVDPFEHYLVFGRKEGRIWN